MFFNFWVLTIFNEGAYLKYTSIFHKALNLLYFDLWNHVRIRSLNQPVLSNKGKVACSRKQQGPLTRLKPMTDTLQARCVTHSEGDIPNQRLLVYKYVDLNAAMWTKSVREKIPHPHKNMYMHKHPLHMSDTLLQPLCLVKSS